MIFHCARPTRGVRDRALREHRRSSGSIPSSVPGAQDQRGCPSKRGKASELGEIMSMDNGHSMYAVKDNLVTLLGEQRGESRERNRSVGIRDVRLQDLTLNALSHTTLDHSRAKEPCETSPILDGGHTRTESTAPESGNQTLAPSGSVPRRRRRPQTKNSVSQGLSGLLDSLPKPCVKVRRFRQ